MNKAVMIALVAGVLSIVAGLIFLLTWDIPAPSQKVERQISDDEFPK